MAPVPPHDKKPKTSIIIEFPRRERGAEGEVTDYRAMSLQVHPDVGGSAHRQSKLTVARDILVARSQMTLRELAKGGAR